MTWFLFRHAFARADDLEPSAHPVARDASPTPDACDSRPPEEEEAGTNEPPGPAPTRSPEAPPPRWAAAPAPAGAGAGSPVDRKRPAAERPKWDFGRKTPQQRRPAAVPRPVIVMRPAVRQQVVRTVQVQVTGAAGPAVDGGALADRAADRAAAAAAAAVQQHLQQHAQQQAAAGGGAWTLRVDARVALVRMRPGLLRMHSALCCYMAPRGTQRRPASEKTARPAQAFSALFLLTVATAVALAGRL